MRISGKSLVAVAALVASATLAVLGWQAAQPYAGFRETALVDLPRGAGTREIARRLSRQGVVRWAGIFLLARALRPGAKLQAGEYEFSRPATVWEVFEKIRRGDVHRYELRIPEGSNRWEVARLAGALAFIREEDVLRETASGERIQDLDPAAATLEGYLFPSTYLLTRETTAAQLVRLMTDEFRRQWRTLEPARDAHTAVTLASLVEKETAVAGERAVVASVYQNRLDAGMKLDCDPTVIYAALLENRYRGTIYKSDLERNHPYNTYRNPGLPPGPIANPGRAALQAALAPARTDFLYFVAKPDGSGGHEFTTTLKDHAKAVSSYRRAQKKGA